MGRRDQDWRPIGRQFRNQVASLLPGLAAACLLGWLASRLSDWVGVSLFHLDRTPVSPITVAILLGLIIGGLLPIPAAFKPGLSFATKKVLRLGIILVGIRLTIFDVLKLGASGVPIVGLCVCGALLVAAGIGRLLKLPHRLGLLIAVGTSICGVSAIVATGSAIDAEKEEVSYAVSVITIFGLVATLVYPYLAHAIFAGNALKAGLFLGTAVHDTSQVIGSAKVYADGFSAPLALDVATVTKLVRNLLMAAIIPLVALYWVGRTHEGSARSRSASVTSLLPLFVVGFVLMAVIRSLGDAGLNAGGKAFWFWSDAAWQRVCAVVKSWAENLLIVALAGVGLSTEFSAIRKLGLRPFIAGLASAVAVGIVSIAAILGLGRWVTP